MCPFSLPQFISFASDEKSDYDGIGLQRESHLYLLARQQPFVEIITQQDRVERSRVR